MDRFEKLIKKAMERGTTEAKIIPVRDIMLDERVILKCQVPLCNDYGNHLLCPPNSPSLSQFREALKRYSKALLIQLRTPAEQLDSTSEANGSSGHSLADFPDCLEVCLVDGFSPISTWDCSETTFPDKSNPGFS